MQRTVWLSGERDRILTSWRSSFDMLERYASWSALGDERMAQHMDPDLDAWKFV